MTAQDFFNDAINHCNHRRYETAIDLFGKALASQPDNAEYRYNRAKALMKVKRFDAAIADFNVLLEASSNRGFYYSERAVAWHLKGSNEQAIADLDQAVALEPDKPFRYSSRAFIKEKMGDLKGALVDYERCISLDPEDAIAFNNKGLVEEKLGYIAKSKKSFSNADHLDSNKKTSATDVAPPTPPEVKPTMNVVEDKKKPVAPALLATTKAIVTDKAERQQFVRFIKQLFGSKS